MNPLRFIKLYRMCELEDVTRECGAATPGIAKMYGIDVDDIVSIPTANLATHTITSSIILKPGKFFKDMPFVEQKAGLTDEIADAVGGGFKRNIPLKYSKYSPQTNKWVDRAIGARFIIIIADNNGQMILVGDKIASVRLEKATGSTGQKFGDENGWDMNLTSEGVKPCFFYTGAVVLQNSVSTFNTTLSFASSASDTESGVTGTSPSTNATKTFEFNVKQDTIELPIAMYLKLGGVNVLLVNAPGDYVGEDWKYTHSDGVEYSGQFINGNVDL